MTIQNIMVLVAIVAVFALWLHQSRISRQALIHARRYVGEQGLQFLDNSVVLCRLRPVRAVAPAWGLCLQRTYKFEFAVRGDRRYRGDITLLGRKVTSINLPPIPEPDVVMPRVE